MDFLKDAALPQSLEHFRLLLFVLNVVFVIFFPYAGYLLGASFFSYRYNLRGRRDADPLSQRFARDLIDTAVFSKSGVAFLAVLPALALVFLYAQILQGTPAIAVGLMGFGFFAILAAGILLYTHRFTFDLAGILARYRSLARTGGDAPDISSYAERNDATHLKAGRYGLLLLLLGVIMAIGAATIAADTESWSSVGNVFQLLIGPLFLTRLLTFFALATGSTGVTVLFVFLSWQGGVPDRTPEYESLIRRFGVRLALIGMLALPPLVVAGYALSTPPSLSGLLYLLGGLALLLVFGAANFVYAFRRDGETRYAAYAFFALALGVILFATRDQMAIANATRLQAEQLSVSYEREVEALKTRLGVALIVMSGKEIYDAKCSACHLFDQKKVGPPYMTVIPKYRGKKAELVGFILNPGKVDPAYPNMPNQGLRPAEADSIATFLLTKFGASGATAPTEGGKQ